MADRPPTGRIRRLLIRGAVVVPAARARWLAPGDILIEDGRIAAVGPRLAARAARADLVLDAADRIAIPGLVNAHAHTYETFNRGLVRAAPMEIWALYGHPVLGVRPRTPEEVYWQTLVPCLEMLRNGVTTVIDDISLFFDFRDELVEAVMQAYRDSGIRAWVSVKVMDRPLLFTLPIDLSGLPRPLVRQFGRVRVPPAERLMEFVRRNMRREDRLGGLARFIPNPSAPQRCTPELLRATHRLAAERDFPWVIHVQETRLQAVQGPRTYGCSMLAYLERLGLLTEVTAVMHGIWLDAADVARLARAGATVVHNPASNLKLGSGLAPVRALRRAGVTVGLGCDGTSSNDGQSVLEAMKLAALVHHVTEPDDRAWLTPADVFEMATEAGARVARWNGLVGAIAPGRRADIVLLDRRAPAFAPLNDPIAQLVYAEAGHAVRTVLVDGRIVVDDGRPLTADLRTACVRLQELADRIRAERARVFDTARRLEPLWRRMLEEHRQVRLPMERLAWPTSAIPGEPPPISGAPARARRRRGKDPTP